MSKENQKRLYVPAAGILAFALVAALAILAIWKCGAWSESEPPQIVLVPDHYLFGKVAEGVKVSHMFQVRNDGGSILIIREAKPKCDCTTVKLSKSLVPAGKSIDLEVTVDTTMKLGKIAKEILISSNDPAHPQVELLVGADVDPHQGMSCKGPSKLFSAKCASCHVQQGVGKTGEDLYLADCAMCHGFKADGATAPSLVHFNLEEIAVRDRLRQITAYGSKTQSTAMPGFIKQAGGPLTGKQIDSLVEYLRWRRSIR